MATKAKFALESDLCAAFIADLARQEPRWVAYAETAGWDILLAHQDGTQIGIEAKLKLNAKVVSQALKRWAYWDTGPDFRAVLVPAGDAGDMGTICDHVGIHVIHQAPLEGRWGTRYLSLPSGSYWGHSWHPWHPMKRHALPDYVPDVTAGSAAPQTLSHWKIAAIKVQIILETRKVQRADIKALALSPSRWFDKFSGFLTPADGGYVASSYMPDFAKAHPTNYAQIKADAPKWMPDVEKGRLL